MENVGNFENGSLCIFFTFILELNLAPPVSHYIN